MTDKSPEIKNWSRTMGSTVIDENPRWTMEMNGDPTLDDEHKPVLWSGKFDCKDGGLCPTAKKPLSAPRTQLQLGFSRHS